MNNNNNQNPVSPFLAATIGGIAGALGIYLFDEKNRKNIKDRYQKLVEEGKENTDKLVSMSEKTLKDGKKTLAKKIREVENGVANS